MRDTWVNWLEIRLEYKTKSWKDDGAFSENELAEGLKNIVFVRLHGFQVQDNATPRGSTQHTRPQMLLPQ